MHREPDSDDENLDLETCTRDDRPVNITGRPPERYGLVCHNNPRPRQSCSARTRGSARTSSDTTPWLCKQRTLLAFNAAHIVHRVQSARVLGCSIWNPQQPRSASMSAFTTKVDERASNKQRAFPKNAQTWEADAAILERRSIDSA